MNDEEFQADNDVQIDAMARDLDFQAITRRWFDRSFDHRYSYHFRWMGLPIIQYPQDIVAMQELIWRIRPDVIIETGVARGGSIVFYASLLKLLDRGGRVIGIDIDIRRHNREAIEAHPMAAGIRLIESSSTAPETVEQVKALLKPGDTVLVILDSNHTHEHVLRELELYSPFVSKDSYLVVFDTVIELMENEFSDRPWGRGNNAHTAVKAFLATNRRFVIDTAIQEKLQITVAPDGYLRCVEGE